MGRKAKVKIIETDATIETPVLNQLALEPGTQVRFRRRVEEHWDSGKLMGESKDGSLSIVDKDGRWRSFMPENVMKPVRGPRGGQSWEPVK